MIIYTASGVNIGWIINDRRGAEPRVCDYCDCRRIPEIADLGAEHDRIEELADDVMRALKMGDGTAATAFTGLIAELTDHVAREEKGVFVEARRVGLGPEYVEDLEDDHRRFAVVLEDPAILDVVAVEAFFDELHRHIAVEEYDLFPTAARLLAEDQWQRIAAGS
jgi:hemerythrin-like domain-containing protein